MKPKRRKKAHSSSPPSRREFLLTLLYLGIAGVLIMGAMVLMLSGTPDQRLGKAVLHCDTDAARDAIERGANVNVKSAEDDVVPQAPILFFAARNGCTEIVELLLASQADSSVETADGKTALMVAEEKGYAEIVRLLKAATENKE